MTRITAGLRNHFLKNLPSPLFAKEENNGGVFHEAELAALWQREIRRDFIDNIRAITVFLPVAVLFLLCVLSNSFAASPDEIMKKSQDAFL